MTSQDHGRNPKQSVLGVLVDALEPHSAIDRIAAAAEERKPFAVSALAVHGVMTAVRNDDLRRRINDLDLVVPDGQPVRWALNLLHQCKLERRTAGPDLMLALCQTAQDRSLGIYLYGSRPETISQLTRSLRQRFPTLIISGAEPSKFRRLDSSEATALGDRIHSSGAHIAFIGLGCPRQEVFVYEHRELARLPLVAVGAAFDYHAGTIERAPTWMQTSGLEWAYRLAQQPSHLWRRYARTNPHFLSLLILQKLGLWRPVPPSEPPPPPSIFYG